MNKYFNPKLIKRNKRYNVVISARDSGRKYHDVKSLKINVNTVNSYWGSNMENTIKDLIERENLIINDLQIENNACKGCKESAIQYHKDLRFVLKAFCDLCYYTEGDYGLDIYIGTGEELDLIKETASKIKGTGKSAAALNKLLEDIEK